MTIIQQPMVLSVKLQIPYVIIRMKYGNLVYKHILVEWTPCHRSTSSMLVQTREYDRHADTLHCIEVIGLQYIQPTY